MNLPFRPAKAMGRDQLHVEDTGADWTPKTLLDLTACSGYNAFIDVGVARAGVGSERGQRGHGKGLNNETMERVVTLYSIQYTLYELQYMGSNYDNFIERGHGKLNDMRW